MKKIFNDKTLLKILSTSESVLAGFLLKGHINKKKEPKRYYFSLRAGNVLVYYSGPSSTEPQGVIFLEGHSVEMGDDYDGRPSLILRFPTLEKRTLFLVADSVEELDTWILALSKVGTDYLSLTVDELEDQLRALEDPGSHAAQPVHPSDRARGFCLNTRQRDNPFELDNAEETSAELLLCIALFQLDFDSVHSRVRSYWESNSALKACRGSPKLPEAGANEGAVDKEPDLIAFD